MDIIKRWDAFCRRIGYMAASVILIMMVVICFDVAARTIGKPILGLIELAELLLVILVFFGFAHAQAIGANVGVTSIPQRLSPGWRAVLGSISSFLCFGLFCIVAWKSGEAMVQSILTKEFRYGAIAYILWPSKTAVFIGCSMLTVEFFKELTINITKVFKRNA